MIRKWLGVSVLAVIALVLLNTSGCGRDQQLVSIQIQPATETFGDSNTPVFEDKGLQVQLRALGTYIHPPVTKDITSQVTWASNTPQMMTVDSSGLVTVTGFSCGGTLVSATATTNTSAGGISSSGAVVTGFMTGSVTCFTGTGGGGGNTSALTLTFSGSGAGTVTSNPAGLSGASPGPFASAFNNGSTVTLTATGTGGANFVSWVGCDTPGTTNPCSVTMTGNRTVTVTFQ
jgi:hypothetical protein